MDLADSEQSENAIGDEPDQFMFAGSSDVAALVKARRDQAQLRKYLLAGKTVAPCGICGRPTPKRYLRAAHIKRRAEASEQERHDPWIAMLACVLGCDQAFECGDIRINSKGYIYLPESADDFTRERFGNLIGKEAPAFTDENRDYFAHRESSFNQN